MLVAGVVGLVALVTKLIDFLRYLVNIRRDPLARSSVLTQLCAWVAGVAGTFLYAASDLGNFAIPGTRLILSDVDGPTKLIVGFAIGSGASVIKDWIKARDNTDSAAVPPLLSPTSRE